MAAARVGLVTEPVRVQAQLNSVFPVAPVAQLMVDSAVAVDRDNIPVAAVVAAIAAAALVDGQVPAPIVMHPVVAEAPITQAPVKQIVQVCKPVMDL